MVIASAAGAAGRAVVVALNKTDAIGPVALRCRPLTRMSVTRMSVACGQLMVVRQRVEPVRRRTGLGFACCFTAAGLTDELAAAGLTDELPAAGLTDELAAAGLTD